MRKGALWLVTITAAAWLGSIILVQGLDGDLGMTCTWSPKSQSGSSNSKSGSVLEPVDLRSKAKTLGYRHANIIWGERLLKRELHASDRVIGDARPPQVPIIEIPEICLTNLGELLEAVRRLAQKGGEHIQDVTEKSRVPVVLNCRHQDSTRAETPMSACARIPQHHDDCEDLLRPGLEHSSLPPTQIECYGSARYLARLCRAARVAAVLNRRRH